VRESDIRKIEIERENEQSFKKYSIGELAKQSLQGW
jgi:hypothetical protein